MAEKTRMIKTRFWSDNFVCELNPLDRYLFLYFLTNEHTNISGIYEVPMRTISFETGIELDMLKKMLERLRGKIFYIDGWVYVRNFSKHQSFNDSVKQGIANAKKGIPSEILEKVHQIDTECTQSVHRVGGGRGVSESISKPISESESVRGVAHSAPTPAMIARDFFDKGKAYEDINAKLCSVIPQGVVSQELEKFISYWTEPNKSGTRQRWEQEKTFEVGRRLKKWFGNIKNYQSAKGKEILV